MRKFILPVLFMGFMLLNAAFFVFVAREFDGSQTTTRKTESRQETRQR